ncbi:MAG: hypothetical protein J7641_07015 [Cyanobacteria bacterium SID2]|nr:hypothetical protein [Cyanobacteria bacterium SID2]
MDDIYPHLSRVGNRGDPTPFRSRSTSERLLAATMPNAARFTKNALGLDVFWLRFSLNSRSGDREMDSLCDMMRGVT